ncbi:unnamed protein product [Paramecium octaurelia]|uniref:Uncharacterized protein n=1 Tax=Paramecium octaurelia TaxID=43137 RepID=A0A8S1XJ14_PAROT|nr:unnamed protein product [Paramecium octaurelia]
MDQIFNHSQMLKYVTNSKLTSRLLYTNPYFLQYRSLRSTLRQQMNQWTFIQRKPPIDRQDFTKFKTQEQQSNDKIILRLDMRISADLETAKYPIKLIAFLTQFRIIAI